MRLSGFSATRGDEACCALFIGLAINLAQTAAAQAAPLVHAAASSPLTWPWLAGAMGGLVAALVHFAAIGLATKPAEPRDLVRAGVEGVFSIIVGAVMATYLSHQVARLAGLTDPGDLSAVSFAIGVGAWRAAPGIIGAARLLASPAQLRVLILRLLKSGDGQ